MKYKVTKVYVVDATTKAEAIEKVNQDPDTLEWVSVNPVTEKTLFGQVKQQLTGK